LVYGILTFVKGSIYRFNLTNARFEKTITDEGGNLFVTVNPMLPKGSVANYGTGDRLFFVQYCALYELFWNKEVRFLWKFLNLLHLKKGTELKCIEHIPGIYSIKQVFVARSLGLILICSKFYHNRVACVIYQPNDTTPGHGNLYEIPMSKFGMCSIPVGKPDHRGIDRRGGEGGRK
jgi:hypothetical protein